MEKQGLKTVHQLPLSHFSILKLNQSGKCRDLSGAKNEPRHFDEFELEYKSHVHLVIRRYPVCVLIRSDKLSWRGCAFKPEIPPI